MISVRISGQLHQRDIEALCRSIDKTMARTAEAGEKEPTPFLPPSEEWLLLQTNIGNTIDLENDRLRDEKLRRARVAIEKRYCY